MKKGQKIKSSVSFSEDLERLSFNLAEKLVETFNVAESIPDKIRLLELIAKYRIPIPKSIEIIDSEEESLPEELETSILNIVKEK